MLDWQWNPDYWEEAPMPELTISQARDHFSALIADLEAGRASEYIIKNRDMPVAKLVPANGGADTSKRIGIAKDAPLLLDDDWFDETDDEVAALFGVDR